MYPIVMNMRMSRLVACLVLQHACLEAPASSANFLGSVTNPNFQNKNQGHRLIKRLKANVSQEILS